MRRVLINSGSILLISVCTLSALILIGCDKKTVPEQTLKDAFSDDFYIGVALTGNQLLGKEPKVIEIVEREFNSIVSENAFKWDSIHPELNRYTFEHADSLVALGERNNMFVIGHVLIWHQQTPKWVFEDAKGNPVSRDTLLQRMRDHIHTIVSRYKGRVHGWDVVNEAVEESGKIRNTKWFEIIGVDYIQKAFEYAREADPDAELYYNDYNIEIAHKRNDTLMSILNDLKYKGVKIDGIGIQAHWHLDMPRLGEIDTAIIEFGKSGFKVLFTEFDINVLPRPENYSEAEVSDNFEMQDKFNPYPAVLPDSMQQVLADRYADIFNIFLKHKNIVDRVTFWGLYDSQSWLNDWPIKGRTNYPLLFDRELKPKPAYYSIIQCSKENK